MTKFMATVYKEAVLTSNGEIRWLLELNLTDRKLPIPRPSDILTPYGTCVQDCHDVSGSEIEINGAVECFGEEHDRYMKIEMLGGEERKLRADAFYLRGRVDGIVYVLELKESETDSYNRLRAILRQRRKKEIEEDILASLCSWPKLKKAA